MGSVHHTRARSKWNLSKDHEVLFKTIETPPPFSPTLTCYRAGLSFFQGMFNGFVDSAAEARQKEAEAYFARRYGRLP